MTFNIQYDFLNETLKYIYIYICLCPCTRVIQACSGIQNLGCWSHTVVSMRQLWFAKFFFGFVNEKTPATPRGPALSSPRIPVDRRAW